jgi:hypothetical protein
MTAALTAALAATVVACSAETEEQGETAGSDAALSETEKALSPADRAKLSAVGFTPREVDAVAESVSISRFLGVQSFVKEANDGDAAPDASIRRESHGKHQGCLRARFDVTAEAGAGVFEKGASYPAWIRLSNGGAYQKDDKAQHISRGWGIKLLGVEGTPTRTHDFLFITSPRFFIHDVTHYPGFLRSSGNGRIGFLWNLLTNMSLEEKAVIVHRLGLQVRNLLESPEYSAVPYRYGSSTVKYALAPCDAGPPKTSPDSQPPPSGASGDYLEEAMNQTLRARGDAGVCYAFYVQRPRSEREDPVDNPTQAWGGAFERVATITIPAGQHRGGPHDYTKNDAECERMAFDPWNTLAESAPVGKTNWTRKFVYASLSDFRRVEMPRLYARWQENRDDASIPVEYRRELEKLRTPSALAPKVKPTHEPAVDEGFRALGITR